MDEAWNGILNTRNQHTWADENPHSFKKHDSNSNLQQFFGRELAISS
jgi:hypothetical protein